MNKSLPTLVALSMAGWLYQAAAQPAPDNGNIPSEPPAPPAAENGSGNGAPPEAAAPAMPPPDTSAAGPDAGPQSPVPGPAAEANGNDNAGKNGAVSSTGIQPKETLGTVHPKVESTFNPPETAGAGSADDLNLNFKNAPIDMVLNYLSDAAGFIIVLDTRVNGTVSVTGKHLTKNEAVDLLNSVLNKNGYAAIRDGRTLTIVEKNDAKTRNIPVKTGNNPAEIPNNDEIVTQIIPIRFVEARQLVSDLSSFVSPQATVVANEAGNSIVITDTQSNIRHLAEIIKAIDGSAEAETEIRVFRLQYANPTDVATELTSVFPSGNSSSGNTQSPVRFGGGFGGGGPGGFFQRMMGGGGGNSGSSSSNDRIKKATQVSAVADARIQAVIVTAPKDMMDEIAGMMKDLDVASTRDQKVYVFHMDNADPQQAAAVLQGMFSNGNSSRSGTSSSQNSALQQREINNNSSSSSSSSTSSGFGGSSGRSGGSGRSF
ncbi:MAG TPA: secretin N-terminal domain-containing protein [Verrucomicrobiae bacterium]